MVATTSLFFSSSVVDVFSRSCFSNRTLSNCISMVLPRAPPSEGRSAVPLSDESATLFAQTLMQAESMSLPVILKSSVAIKPWMESI